MILVVEDSQDDAELTLHALRGSAGPVEIEVARDGREALDILLGGEAIRRNREQPEIILLDLKLPKISGLEVLRTIKADPATRRIPVIVFTSSGEPLDIERAYELGANSYVQKPVSFASLNEAIGRLRSYWLTLNVAAP